MPMYQYETIPTAGEPAERFELRQSINDAPVTVHPQTGTPVRRVISGGLGLMPTASERGMPEPGPGCGPGSCGCGRF